MYKIQDLGFEKALKALRALADTDVEVGIFDEKQAEIGSFQGYGTDTIPARSFIRAPLDANSDKIFQVIADELSGEKVEHHEGLQNIGEFIKDLFVKAIDSNIPPPNAPATVAKKGFSHTLIETGAMRSSIEYKILTKGSEDA